MTHSRLSALPSRMALLALAGMLALAGCNQRHDTVSMEPAPPPAPMAGGAGMKQSRAANVQAEDAAAAAPAQDEMAQRFLAVRQELNVEVPQAQLADAWGQVRDLCATLRCELLTATLLRETPQQPGNALLEMRVAPADVDRLLGTLAGVATIVSQNTISEDKTTEVIDVEARIKNRTDFRDSLRLMLRDMSDLLEIQRTLSDTQAELDAMAAQRKLLEQQTSKQHIQIQFTPTRALVQGGTSYSPIGRALRDAGHVLGESMGALITFVAAVLPWLVLVVLPLGWMLRALWRRRRARRG
jgi:predicted component of type VI protein secretion system